MRRLDLLAPLVLLLALPTVLFAGACVGDDPSPSGVVNPDEAGAGEGGVDGQAPKQTLAVATAAKAVSVLPSNSVTLDVTVTRGGGFAGPVKVTLTGLPGGVTADPVTVAANETKGTFTLTAGAAPTQGVATVGISAQSSDAALGATASVELVVRGVAGTLDTSFAGTGIVADASLLIEAIALQKDGKIVLGGSAPQSGPFGDNYGAVRLDTAGKLDPTFATGGRFKATLGTAAPGYSNYVIGVVIDDTTGNILIGGSAAVSSTLRLGAMRLDKNGKQDMTYGAAGAGGAIGPSLARGVKLLSHGANAFLAGFATPVISGPVVVGRLGAAGFDTAFGTGGMATATGHNLSARDAVIQSDGKVLVCGQTGAIGTDGIATVIRLNTDGAVDTAYGVDGEFHYDNVGTNEEAQSMALLPNDKVVIAGSKLGGSGAIDEVYVQVVGSNGATDPTFGVPLPHAGDGDGNASATVVVVQPDGLILVLGYAKKGTYQGFVWRLLKSGAPDPAFNGGTPVYRPASTGSYLPSAAVIDAYNRLIVTTEATVTRLWL